MTATKKIKTREELRVEVVKKITANKIPYIGSRFPAIPTVKADNFFNTEIKPE